MKIVKKLSMKILAGGRPKIPEAEGETNWIAKVAGIANGTKTGESNFGLWVALIGNFAAEQIGVEKPERFRTGVMFLPDVALNLVTPALEAAGKGAAIEFAFQIGVIKDDSAATGYVYVAESLIEPSASDPLEALSLKALGAPKKEETPKEEKGSDESAKTPATSGKK